MTTMEDSGGLSANKPSAILQTSRGMHLHTDSAIHSVSIYHRGYFRPKFTTMPLGSRKRKATSCFYQKGHRSWNCSTSIPVSAIPDSSSVQQPIPGTSSVQQPTPGTSLASSIPTHAGIGDRLRTRNPDANTRENLFSGNRIVNMTEMIHVMNTVYRGHSETKCLNLNVNINQEIKFGLEFKTQ